MRGSSRHLLSQERYFEKFAWIGEMKIKKLSVLCKVEREANIANIIRHYDMYQEDLNYLERIL